MHSNKRRKLLDETLSITLALIVLAAICLLVYTVVAPMREKFTEFYILGAGNMATNYPDLLELGQDGDVTIVVVNYEKEPIAYEIKTRIDGVIGKTYLTGILEHRSKCEQVITLTPKQVEGNQKVEFLLFKQGSDKVYLDLHLWVSIKGDD